MANPDTGILTVQNLLTISVMWLDLSTILQEMSVFRHLAQQIVESAPTVINNSEAICQTLHRRRECRREKFYVLTVAFFAVSEQLLKKNVTVQNPFSLAEFASAGAKKVGSFLPETAFFGKNTFCGESVRAKQVRERSASLLFSSISEAGAEQLQKNFIFARKGSVSKALRPVTKQSF